MGMSRIGQALTAREILNLVDKDMRRVEEVMRLESVASVEAISAINKHIQASGGKRLRPTLVLLSTQLFAPLTDTAIAMAAVVEMIHTATLVHDDVIDAARERRHERDRRAAAHRLLEQPVGLVALCARLGVLRDPGLEEAESSGSKEALVLLGV